MLTPIVGKLKDEFEKDFTGYNKERRPAYIRKFLIKLFDVIEDKKVDGDIREMLGDAVDRLCQVLSQNESGNISLLGDNNSFLIDNN